MNMLIAMLVSVTIVGGSTGTQSYTIQGFDSLEACQNAREGVKRQFEEADRQRGMRGKPLVITTCIEASKGGAAAVK
jgi:hypothetical protein